MSIESGEATKLDIFQGEATVAYPAISNGSTYNMFEFTFPNSEQRALIPTAGFELLHEISATSRWRGIFSSNLLSAVVIGIGNSIYLTTPTHWRLLFNIETLSGKIYFEENAILTQPTDTNPGGQVAVSDGANIYIYQINGVMTKATNDGGEELGFRPGMLSFQDDTFFCNDINSNRIFQSTIIDGRTWPADKFGIIDNETRGCLCLKTILFVFGNDITQLFHDAALPQGFTYTKDTIRSFEYGIVNAESVGKGLDFFVWLGQTQYSQPTILLSNGGNPQVISTPGIDAILNQLTKPEDNNGFIYDQWGHTFYQINFFTDNISLLYNITTKKWYRVSNHQFKVHPIQGVASYQGRNVSFAISSEKGNIYRFGLDYFNNDGKIVPRSIITPNMVYFEKPKVCSVLELQVEQGENQDITRVHISISKDRGRVFRPYKNKIYGRIGFRRRLMRFYQFGASKWWTFKIDIYSLDRVIILDATAYMR